MMPLATGRSAAPASQPEIWAGVECTVNRVADRYSDQLALSKHFDRVEDIDRFADLGIRALRFPILWERMQPERETIPAWSSTDNHMRRLQRRNVRPIVGLLHHGYGPQWFGLLDPEFPGEFARYAATVASRYPWVDAYTPVNEPLTTARFSGLYGHWFPHTRDTSVFARLLIAQCRSIVEAMRAIRVVNSDAQLIQTEDLGKVSGSPSLTYQIEFENERRWLTWDILTGAVGPWHSMWHYLRSAGIGERELWAFVNAPCAPDILGVNHYVTSERFLDDRIEQYDESLIGGNGRHRYADVATVNVGRANRAGMESLLLEAAERYAKPLAITECHLGCTREEQLRWLHEVWRTARELCDRGIDIRAVTIWGLLGLYDWDSLVTKRDEHYETGAFDMRAPQPRPTAIAQMVQALATTGKYDHPVLETGGWWHSQDTPRMRISPVTASHRRLLIIGATGTLGQALARICETRGIAYHLLGRRTIDIADVSSVTSALALYDPWAVINAAGYVNVDAAETDRERCWRENVHGVSVLAEACARHDVPIVTYSSDLVFSGRKGSAYVESDIPSPLNCYGESKAAAERVAAARAADALVIRSAAFFGPWDEYNIVAQGRVALRMGRTFIVPGDLIVTPTYVPDLAHATIDLLLDGERGIWHLSNGTPVTWADLLLRVAEQERLPTELVIPRSAVQMCFAACRPVNSALASERGWIMPSLDDALMRYAHDCAHTDPLASLVT